MPLDLCHCSGERLEESHQLLEKGTKYLILLQTCSRQAQQGSVVDIQCRVIVGTKEKRSVYCVESSRRVRSHLQSSCIDLNTIDLAYTIDIQIFPVFYMLCFHTDLHKIVCNIVYMLYFFYSAVQYLTDALMCSIK